MLLNDEQMFKEWIRDVKTMSGRIIEMREALYNELVKNLKTPGNWEHILNQIGMFSFTGLNPDQCKKMVENAHIYMTGNGKHQKKHNPHFQITLLYFILPSPLFTWCTESSFFITLFDRTYLNGWLEYQ